MPIFRLTIGFAGNNVGWTETHLLTSQFTNPQQLVQTVRPVLQARAAMLANPFQVNGLRISSFSDGANRPARLPRQPWLDKSVFGPGGTSKSWASEPNSVQYQAIGITNPNFNPQFLAGNKNYTYLGGPADVTVTDDGTVQFAQNNIQALFNTWASALVTANIGWGGSLRGTPLKVTAVVQNPDATVTFTTAPVDLTMFPLGGPYPVRVRRMNNGRSPLNGQLVCQLVSATTWTTVEQVAFALAQTNGQLTPYWPTPIFIPYFGLTLASQVVKHKRGRPFLSEPGRQPKRVRA